MASVSTGILLILGIGVFGGIIGATLFQRLHIPQVVGYIAMGLLIGDVGLGLVSQDAIGDLESLNLFALGIIGFLVGGELRLDVFRKQGKQLFSILLFEGVAAFAIVGVSVSLIVHAVSGDVAVAIAAGVVFGAIASATDPASTLNVLREYRSRGVLTTTLIAIVALDDALAMTLYGMGTAVAQVLTGGTADIGGQILKTSMELGGAVLLGVVSGYVLRFLVRWLKRKEKNFSITVGVILLVIGVCAVLEMDVILAAMTLGVTLVNIAPRRSKEMFSAIRSFADPIYVIFFVLVGARLNVDEMPAWLWGIVAVYVVGRSVGKIGGAYIGGRLTHAAPTVYKYTGLGLFAQGGIAVGLSIMAAHHLDGIEVNETLSLGDMIVFGVTASTLVLQITGPPLIKLASRLSGEIGRDVTEEDVIESWSVSDAMIENVSPITQGTPLAHVFQIFAAEDHLVFPVVDGEGRMKGVITLEDLKGVMMSQETWDWVLAADVMAPVEDKVAAETPLQEALDYMRECGVEEMPVVTKADEEKVLGVLDQRLVRIRVNAEVVKRRQTENPSEAASPE